MKEEYYKSKIKDINKKLDLKTKALINTQEELRQKNKKLREFRTELKSAFDKLKNKLYEE